MPDFRMISPVPVVFGDVGEIQPDEIVTFDEAPSTTWWEPVTPDVAPAPEPTTDPAPAA